MAGLSAKRQSYLDALGIVHWVRRTERSADDSSIRDTGADAGESVGLPPDAPVPVSADWRELEALVSNCTRCDLHKTRTQTVFGTGDRAATWMFVGEAPGAEEDRQGLPFVGRAGQLLNATLRAIGLERKEVYIANVLKCRPPNNRDPMGQEVRECEPYLHQQIKLIRPGLIVALGRFAAQSLLKTTRPISKLRGETFTYEGIPLIVTYHPAYLLRNALDKRKMWDDLCRARALLEAGS